MTMVRAIVAPSTLGTGDLPVVPFLLNVARVATVEPKLLSISATGLTLQLAFRRVWRHG